MIREKIINWNPLTEKPTIEKDDEFVVGDSGVNQITLKVDPKYDNYQAQMVLSRLNSNVGYLDLQVVTGGKAIFKVPSEFINLGVSVVYFRLAQNGEVITSCGYKYTISCGKIYSEIKINSTNVDELLKELNETITKASNTNDLLTTTTDVANQVNTKLEDTITKGKSLQTDLDSRNAQAIVNVDDLSNSNSTASKNITNLKSENAEADSNILNLNIVNTTASKNISDLNSENAEAKTNVSNLGIQNNASITNVSTLTSKNAEATTNLQNIQNKIDEVPLKIQDIETTGSEQIRKVAAEGDKKISEIQAFPASKSLNINDNNYYSTWLGTEQEFDSIIDKQRGVFYMGFDNLFSLTKTWFRPKLEPVKRGLVEWYDYMDGKGTEITLKSRVSENNITLNNFNFDSNGGWTGKGLKFDGVDDVGIVNNKNVVNFLKGDFTIETTFLTPQPALNKYRVSLSVFEYMLMCSAEGQFIHINKIGYKPVLVFTDAKTVNTFVKKGDKMEYYQNAVLKGTYTLDGWDSNVDSYVDGRIFIGSNKIGANNRYSGVLKFSDIFYNVALTPEEIQHNYEYEQSIDRNVAVAYPLLKEEKSYGIGLASQLTEEQIKTFRLSNDKTKFVAGLRYCKGLQVDEYTYTEILNITENEEWGSLEETI